MCNAENLGVPPGPGVSTPADWDHSSSLSFAQHMATLTGPASAQGELCTVLAAMEAGCVDHSHSQSHTDLVGERGGSPTRCQQPGECHLHPPRPDSTFLDGAASEPRTNTSQGELQTLSSQGLQGDEVQVP